jgi:hypothetical protein
MVTRIQNKTNNPSNKGNGCFDGAMFFFGRIHLNHFIKVVQRKHMPGLLHFKTVHKLQHRRADHAGVGHDIDAGRFAGSQSPLDSRYQVFVFFHKFTITV